MNKRSQGDELRDLSSGRRHLTKDLIVDYGARHDYVDAFVQEGQLSPRLGVVYKIFEQTTLHAGYARYFTPPPTELVRALCRPEQTVLARTEGIPVEHRAVKPSQTAALAKAGPALK